MIRCNAWKVLAGVATLALGLAGCTQQAEQGAVRLIQDKTLALTPAAVSLKASFLTGQLLDLKVTQRVEQDTGKVVDQPKLRATLKLRNDSQDQAARLVAGRVVYLDAEKKPIPMAEGRSDTTFKFPSYQTDRLDPGTEMSQEIDVPFPATAVTTPKSLRDLRLELIYLPTPYRKEAIDIPVSLGG